MYLESSLTDIPQLGGQSRNFEKSVEIRKALLNFFKNRDCQALIRPHRDEKMLQRLQDLPDASLEPAFLEGIYQIRQKIVTTCSQKVIEGIPLNGTMILTYLGQFVAAFNSNTKPLLSTAWRALLESECESAYKNASDEYGKNTREFLQAYNTGIDPLHLQEER